VAAWFTEAGRTLEPSMVALKQWLVASRLERVDATGIRVKGLLRWMHVIATKWLTLYSWHKIRSSLSPMRKQDRSLLAAVTAGFEGTPFDVAWEPGT